MGNLCMTLLIGSVRFVSTICVVPNLLYLNCFFFYFLILHKFCNFNGRFEFVTLCEQVPPIYINFSFLAAVTP